MTIEIQPCKISHLHRLMGSLRAEERAELDIMRIKPRHAMIALWKATPEPWAAVDETEQVLAVWGDAAPTLASIGLPWVFSGSAIERVPLWFFREVRRQIEKMLVSRETLRCEIAAGCTKALRFYALVGFEIGEAVDGFHQVTYAIRR